jgi:hypothetical protein
MKNRRINKSTYEDFEILRLDVHTRMRWRRLWRRLDWCSTTLTMKLRPWVLHVYDTLDYWQVEILHVRRASSRE